MSGIAWAVGIAVSVSFGTPAPSKVSISRPYVVAISVPVERVVLIPGGAQQPLAQQVPLADSQSASMRRVRVPPRGDR